MGVSRKYGVNIYILPPKDKNVTQTCDADSRIEFNSYLQRLETYKLVWNTALYTFLNVRRIMYHLGANLGRLVYKPSFVNGRKTVTSPLGRMWSP